MVDYREAVLEQGARSLDTPKKALEPHGVRDNAGRHPLLADEDLVSLVGDGDARAFASLYDRHSRGAYSLAYRMMGERQAAEDLLQEVFLKVWRGAGSYRAERGSVRTWIHSIVRNRGIDQIRYRESRSRTREKLEALAPRSEPSEAFASAWRNSRWDRAQEALATLPHAQLEVLALSHLCELTHEEIAARLRLPLGTVKGRMRLGLKKLREYSGLQGMAVE